MYFCPSWWKFWIRPRWHIFRICIVLGIRLSTIWHGEFLAERCLFRHGESVLVICARVKEHSKFNNCTCYTESDQKSYFSDSIFFSFKSSTPACCLIYLLLLSKFYQRSLFFSFASFKILNLCYELVIYVWFITP